MLYFLRALRPHAPLCRFSSCCPTRPPTVTILDGSSTVGKNLALLLKQNPHVGELRIHDAKKDVGSVAHDLNTIDTKAKVLSFKSDSLREAISDADVVIATGGCQTKPGQSQRGLFEKNVDSVRNTAIFLAEFNPNAVFCISKPPIEALVPMVAEEYKKADCFDYRKIIGVTAPASMIASHLIGHQLGIDPADVLCPIIGGFSPKTTIPVISQTKPALPYSSKVFVKLQEDIAKAEETLLEKGTTFCFSKALAISRFINALMKALKGDPNCVECAFVGQLGHIGEFLPYMTSIVKLGTSGIQSSHMPKLNDLEVLHLKAAVPFIMENILLGQTFVSGDFSAMTGLRKKRRCDLVLKQKLEDRRMRAGMTPCKVNCE